MSGVNFDQVVNGIECLSEDEKNDLKIIYRRPARKIVKSLRSWVGFKEEEVQDELMRAGFIEEVFTVLCPYCADGVVSDYLSSEEKERVVRAWEEEDEIEAFRYLNEESCATCLRDLELDLMDLHVEKFYKFV